MAAYELVLPPTARTAGDAAEALFVPYFTSDDGWAKRLRHYAYAEAYTGMLPMAHLNPEADRVDCAFAITRDTPVSKGYRVLKEQEQSQPGSVPFNLQEYLRLVVEGEITLTPISLDDGSIQHILTYKPDSSQLD